MNELLLEKDDWKIMIVSYRNERHYKILCPCWKDKEYYPVLKVIPVCFDHRNEFPEALRVAWRMFYD